VQATSLLSDVETGRLIEEDQLEWSSAATDGSSAK
jgi:hypothetical protein